MVKVDIFSLLLQLLQWKLKQMQGVITAECPVANIPSHTLTALRYKEHLITGCCGSTEKGPPPTSSQKGFTSAFIHCLLD